jgi:hypothetical protein
VAEAGPLPYGSETSGARLTIEFHESGDRRNDLERLRRLHAVLAQSTGDDPYAIVFVAGERRSRLVGAQLRLRYSPQFAQSLEQILGPGCVNVSFAEVEALA